MFTLGEAAKKVGKSKTTLTRAIKSGRMSATRLEDGSYQIDPAELFRVYDETPETVTLSPNGAQSDPVTVTGNAVNHATVNATVAELQAKLDASEIEKQMLSERISELRAERDDWKAEAGDWKKQSNNATLLLSHEQQKNQRRWWQW